MYKVLTVLDLYVAANLDLKRKKAKLVGTSELLLFALEYLKYLKLIAKVAFYFTAGNAKARLDGEDPRKPGERRAQIQGFTFCVTLL